jgi:hypothetical protein
VSNAPTTSAAPEWDILLAASSASSDGSARDRIRRLLEKPVDWGMLLRLAENHGTSSLLYQSLLPLADMVPSSTLASLRQRYEGNVYKSLFLVRELIRIVERLEGLFIDAVPYKGVVMSEVYYGDMALRQSGDMDLFVRKRDLLELQWALQPRFYAVDFDMDGLFERAVKVTVAGHCLKAPSPEDLLLVLSVHAAKHVWGRLIWLCDIAQILKRENLDWDQVQVRTREIGIERILRITLLLANRFLGTAIPAATESAVLADRAALGLADEIAAALAAGVSYDTGRTSYFRLMMRLRERRADRLRFLARLAFTPGPGEWEAVRLPGPLSPLYRVVRLVRLGVRLTRG